MSENILDVSSIVKSHKVRYIIDESFGSTNNDFNTSWVEVQCFDVYNRNIALGKKVTANFYPMLDVTGQSPLSIITNGNITQREWVSCNIAILKHLPAKIIIDLGEKYSDVEKIVFYHGWWTERSYKNRIYIADNLHKPILLYDYHKDGPVYESLNKPLILKLK